MREGPGKGMGDGMGSGMGNGMKCRVQEGVVTR